MLQLQTKGVDLCRISKLLVKYNIKASITNQLITLNGDISEDLLKELCESIDINSVQNYISEEQIRVPEEISAFNIERKIVDISQEDEIPQTNPTLLDNTLEYDLIYSEVKRGEVYWCDYGEPYGSEQGGLRPAIIIQNDDGNLHSDTTIVICCTTQHKHKIPTHINSTFSSENMFDYDMNRVGARENVIMAEQIRTVDKTRLRDYIGTLTPEFMQTIQEKLDISLNLIRKEKVIVKQEKVFVDKPVYKKSVSENLPEHKDLNLVQVRILSFVDINEILQISQTNSTDEIKAKKILEIFGFDFNRNGVQYLLKAIIASPKDAYFNLETLAEKVSKKENIDKEEIKRLIVARVKEKFNFKKSPTIDFIRLVNSFLLKQEE